MTARKKTPTRDPSAEPFASPYSDEERSKLDTPAALAEIQRATRKSEAARQQNRGGRKLFVDPDLSEHSAMASVLTHVSMVETLANWGSQLKTVKSKGGKGRAQQRKDEAALAADAIRAEAMRLLATKASHEICGILMTRGFGGRDKILRALRGDPTLAVHWPKLKKKSRKLSL